MSRRIVALPVDGRPVVREQVRQLAAVAGLELVMPEVAALGFLRQPADRDTLAAWLEQQAAGADAILVSLDMLLYGGLVPSRLGNERIDAIRPRLALLRRLQAAAPQRPLLAFAATMRISNNNVAEEERPYWATHGERLWRWSHESDRAQQMGDVLASAAATEAEATIPQTIRDDYRRARERNHRLTLAALELVQEGVIQHLVLPQDDTAGWGFNIAERRELQARVAQLGLEDRVAIRPGADEALHTLVARVARGADAGRPLRVRICPSDSAGFAAMTALYEDRPLAEAVTAQIAAIGAVPVDDESPDLLLAVHTQGAEQGDWAMQRPLPQRRPIDSHWLRSLADADARGIPVAIADLAYANGGDPWLVNALAPVLPPRRWAAYAGWNTASNSLGSALAQASLALQQGNWRTQPLHRHNLALRLAEDVLYQALLRQTWRLADAGVLADPPVAGPEQLAALFKPLANAQLAAWQLGWRVAEVQLPWQRSFELDLRLEPLA